MDVLFSEWSSESFTNNSDSSCSIFLILFFKSLIASNDFSLVFSMKSSPFLESRNFNKAIPEMTHMAKVKNILDLLSITYY